MGPRWISSLLFFSGCKVSLRLIPFSAGAAFHYISICAAFSYILYIAALHCCVLYRAGSRKSSISGYHDLPERTETDRNGPKRTFVDTETDFLGTETDFIAFLLHLVDTETDRDGPERTETDRNVPKRTETDRNGPKRTFVDTETDFLGTETDFLGTETDFLGTETDFSGYRNGLFGYKIVIRGA